MSGGRLPLAVDAFCLRTTMHQTRTVSTEQDRRAPAAHVLRREELSNRFMMKINSNEPWIREIAPWLGGLTPRIMRLRLNPARLKCLIVVWLALVPAAGVRSAESAFVGSWKVPQAPVELTIKGDGTGSLALPDLPKAAPFKWEKTPEGATLYFDAAAIGHRDTNVFLRVGSTPNEIIFKDSKGEVKLNRDDGQKRKEIERLLRVSGTDKLIDQHNGLLMSSLRTGQVKLPEETWKKLEQQVDIGAAREKIIAECDMHYTIEELKSINAFYESPAGKKELAKRYVMMQRGYSILQSRADKIQWQAAEEARK